MLAIENGNRHVGVLGAAAVVFLLREALLERADVLLGFSILLRRLVLQLLLERLVRLGHLLGILLDVLRNLPILLKLQLNFLLGVCLLGKHHLPPSQVVERLVLVRLEVPFDEGAVPHGNLLAFALDRAAARSALDIGQSHVGFLVLDWLTRARGVIPIFIARRVHSHSREEQTKHVEQAAFGRGRFDFFAVLGESEFKSMVH